MLTYAIAFLLALLSAAILTPIVCRIAWKYRWLDIPEETRRMHRKPVPRVGGIAVFVAFFVPIAGLAIYVNRISGFLYADEVRMFALALGAFAIVGLGVFDDLKGAGASLKFGVQGIVAAGLWYAGFRVDLLGNPMGDPVMLDTTLSFAISVVWIVGVINAMNLIDGLDGLASGVALFASSVLFAVAFVGHNVLLALFMASLVGALLGFLFFNFNPARIFLGDSGSMFLGYILAMASLWTHNKSTAAVAVFIPLLALGLPLLDTSLSIVRRVGRRQNPFRADREHLHHRLMALGLSHKDTVLTLYIVSAVFSLGALALLDTNTTRRAIALATVGGAAILLVHRVGVWRKPAPHGGLILDAAFKLLRDRVRVAGRSIRMARNAEEVWHVLRDVLPSLGCLEARVVLSAWAPGGQEEVFRWMSETEGPSTLDLVPAEEAEEAPPVGVWIRPLAEGEHTMGQVALVSPETGDRSRDLVYEILRDALIDFSVRHESQDLPRVHDADFKGSPRAGAV